MSERAIEAGALEYATNLAKALARKHYPDVPQWKPADDLMTVLTQIDNMTTGMIRPAALAEDDAAVERIKAALAALVPEVISDDGLVCSVCRGRGGHLDGCEAASEGWPTITVHRKPTPEEQARAALRALGE